MKWEPLVAMALLVLLGAWLIYQPRRTAQPPDAREGARLVEYRIGQSRGWIEHVPGASEPFRVIGRDGSASAPIGEAEFVRAFGPELHGQVVSHESVALFRLLNITGWGSLVWIGVGVLGQAIFSCRFLIQWIVSEKKRESVIPEAFWWISLGGGLSLFAYFVWRQDLVAVAGQSTGMVIYARNLRLIHKQRRRLARRAASGEPG